MTSQAETLFRIEHLHKSYEMGEISVQALHDVNLKICQRELIVMLGPSGSGKSTLLNILGGLDTATSGNVHYQDHDLTDASEKERTAYRREHVGFVFQFYNLIPSLTAKENVEIVTEIARDPMPAEEALTMVGLQDRANHFPSQLSGGEQQRVAIARAIAKRPDVLFCDEPTGALDSKTGILVLEALSKVNRELGTTTVLITHNVVIGQMADRVVYLHDGTISEIQENKTKISPAEMSW